MYKLIRFYNQNRRAILIIILIIAFFFMLLRIVDYYSSRQTISTGQQAESYENLANSVVSNKSALTGSTVSSSQLTENTDVIDNFFKYCKQNDINKAYSLLSSDCKEQLFPNEEEFKNRYVDIIFYGEDKVYTIENYYSNIYKINITDNALATGKSIQTSNQDYISIVKENNETKLNVNGLVDVFSINNEQENYSVKVKVNKLYQYMDYTVISIDVTNNNELPILLDKLQDIEGIYISDSNNTKYGLYSHEYVKEDLKVLSKETKKVNLKFYSKYISSKEIRKLNFKNVILNFDDGKYLREIQMSIDIKG